jgi:small subunit ribosomal protein S2
MPYVNQRWPGGMLTNYQTIRKSLEQMFELERLEESGEIELRVKKERNTMMKEKARLQKFLGGIRNMNGLPTVIFIADCRKERIAIAEANKLRIPVVASWTPTAIRCYRLYHSG